MSRADLRLTHGATPLIIVLVALVAATARAQEAAGPNPSVMAFVHGQWFDGRGLTRRTAYSVNGLLTFKRPTRIERTVDLHEGFVVPPFGEAHNHNVETLNKVDALIERYLLHGIFYVKNPNNLARDRDALVSKLDRPDGIDVSFSNGSLTGSGGHPLEIPARVIRSGKWTEADGEGGFYYNRGQRIRPGTKVAGIACHPSRFHQDVSLVFE